MGYPRVKSRVLALFLTYKKTDRQATLTRSAITSKDGSPRFLPLQVGGSS
jgi:hypothetical protein